MQNKQHKQRVALLAVPNRDFLIRAFVEKVLNIKRTLSFKYKYVDYQQFLGGVNDISGIIFDEQDRLIFTAGEEAVMNAEYKAGPREMQPRLVYLVGTEYGMAVIHGRRDSYDGSGDKVVGETPQLHATMALRMACMRHLVRQGKKEFSLGQLSQDSQLMEWILSPNFREQCAEQAAIDVANGITLGDGMKVFEPKVRPIATAPAKPFKTARRPQSETKPTWKGKPREQLNAATV